MVTETEGEIANMTEKGSLIETGAEEAVIETRGVLATSISRTSGASVGAIGAVRRMEGIIDTPTPNAIDQLAATIAGRSLLEMIAGKIPEMTEWVAAGDGATTEVAEAAAEAKSTGQSPLPGMNDWRWSCLALAILGSILANTRISQLRLPERTYHHTSHL